MKKAIHLTILKDDEYLDIAKMFDHLNHLEDKSKIFHVKNLIENSHCGITNLSGKDWYKVWKYLESKGYEIFQS